MDIEHFRGTLNNPRTWIGLSQDDRLILTQHISGPLKDAKAVYFNVPVWNPAHDPLANNQLAIDMKAALTWYRRIDLLAKYLDKWLLCEIKPSAAYVALGQVLAYRALWTASWPQTTPTSLVVITDAMDPALRETYTTHAVAVLEQPGSTYSPRTRPT